jgi:pimeloyl-ACP methyl ester carboxylesterase
MSKFKIVGMMVLIAFAMGIVLMGDAVAAPSVKKVTISGTELTYIEDGKGEPVVFVHGAVSDWRTWEGVRPFIAQKYCFVSYSRRYHFPNVWTDDGQNYTMSQHVEDLAAFIGALNVGRVHLVGHSWGGIVAGIMALKYPELVQSLVLSEARLIAQVSPEGEEATQAFGQDTAKSKAAALSGDYNQAVVLLVDAVSGASGAWNSFPPDAQQSFLDNARAVAAMHKAPATRLPSCAELGKFNIPVMVLGSEKSRANYRFANERLLQCLPKGTEQAVIPGAGHLWPPVNPKGGAEAIIRFIEKHPISK